MNDADTLMVRILALTDAVWLPMRSRDFVRFETNAVLAELRRDYTVRGLLFKSGEASSRARLEHQHHLEDLAGRGLLQRFGRQKYTRVRLTDAGEQRARALCGLALLDSAHSACAEIVRLNVNDKAQGRDDFLA
jgi:hypothetical protein